MSVEVYAVIDSQGNVANIIMADGNYAPEAGYSVELTGSTGAEIGWTYQDGVFVAPATPSPTPEHLHEMLVMEAQIALNRSDITIIRCYSAAVVVPNEWQAYRSALRSIINGSDETSTSLPSIPSYPPGT